MGSECTRVGVSKSGMARSKLNNNNNNNNQHHHHLVALLVLNDAQPTQKQDRLLRK